MNLPPAACLSIEIALYPDSGPVLIGRLKQPGLGPIMRALGPHIPYFLHNHSIMELKAVPATPNVKWVPLAGIYASGLIVYRESGCL
jgi:hypothetical protein